MSSSAGATGRWTEDVGTLASPLEGWNPSAPDRVTASSSLQPHTSSQAEGHLPRAQRPPPSRRPKAVSSQQEHAAFEEGLRTFGTNWRRIQATVPTRTLVQIRTHAQKYFLRHGAGAAAGRGPRVGGEGGEDGSGMGEDGGSGAGGEPQLFDFSPLTVRHIALEPLHPLQPLGLALAWRGDLNHCVITGIDATVGGGDRAASAEAGVGASSSPDSLIRVGDVVLGVSGMSTINLGPASVLAAMDASRAAVPGGLLVLHLSDQGFDAVEVVEASVQMASAAASLLGAQSYVELSMAAQQSALFASVRQLPV